MEVGAVSVMLYCFRERELLLNINEMIAGFRLFPSYMRVGGLREDLPPRLSRGCPLVSRPLRRQARRVRRSADEERDLPEADAGRRASSRRRTRSRTASLGPIARAAGVGYDVRKVFSVSRLRDVRLRRADGRPMATSTRAITVRVAEMRESMKICRQALERITPTGAHAVDDPRITPPPKDRVYTEMEALIQHFLIYSQGFTVPAGEAYVPVEGPRGEQGFHVVSDGTNRPWRVKSRAPSLLACQALERMIVGGLIADVIAVIGSIDVVMGDVDR